VAGALLLLASDAAAAHAFLVVVVALVVGVASSTAATGVEMAVEVLKHNFFSVSHIDYLKLTC
jgi:hypothetical protein